MTNYEKAQYLKYLQKLQPKDLQKPTFTLQQVEYLLAMHGHTVLFSSTEEMYRQQGGDEVIKTIISLVTG